MPMSIGIIGLPNVGKSTLFNALTKKCVEASNFPFCTINPNVGVVPVPDERLEKIAIISKPKKVTPATIEFIDIAGLVKGAHLGEGLGNQFLSHIRESDAICEVVRDFTNDNIVHVYGKIDPAEDKETVNLELIMADLQSVEKSLFKINKEAKSGDKEIIKVKAWLEKMKQFLETGKAMREMEFSEEEREIIQNFNFLTSKPVIYILNEDDKGSKHGISDWAGKVLKINAKTEEEIADLPAEEQREYIKELGLGYSGLEKLIKASEGKGR